MGKSAISDEIKGIRKPENQTFKEIERFHPMVVVVV